MLGPLASVLELPPALRILAPHQQAFVRLKARKRTNCSGRRSGKTFAAPIWLTEGWEGRPNQSAVFAALTTEHAIRIAWDAFAETFEKLGIKAVYTATPSPVWTLPNGFTVYMTGLKDLRQANHLRGIPKLFRVIIDESGQIPDPLLAYAVKNIVLPALADTDGQLALTGTPSDTGEGFYENMMQECEANGAHFCNTMADNPHLARPGAELMAQALREDYGNDPTNVDYRREILGERIRDPGVLVYPQVSPELFFARPPRAGAYVSMGIDIGWFDGVGFSVVASKAPEPGGHILAVYRQEEMMLPAIAAKAEQLRVEHQVSEMFFDSAGGGGRTMLETLSGQYGLPVQRADKRNRLFRIHQMRGMLASGTLTGSDEAREFLQESSAIPWNKDQSDHRPGYIDEIVDATQYAMGGAGFTFATPWVESADAGQTSAYAAAHRRAARRRGRR